MSAQPVEPQTERPSTLAEYLVWEAGQEERHEFDGQVVAMVGGTDRHDLVATAITRRLVDALDEGPCRVFTHNRQLLTEQGRKSRYRDVLVRCSRGDDPNREDDADLVVEVLSASTAKTDVTDKLSEYAGVPSLRHYLVVDPDAEHAFLYERRELGWYVTEHRAKDVVRVGGVDLDLGEVFAYVNRKLG